MRFVPVLAIMAATASSAAAAAPHSPSACAVAWNRTASAGLHAVLAKADAHAASIDPRTTVGRDTWSKTGGTTSTSALGCTIRVGLPAGRVLLLWGRWRAGMIHDWHASLASAHLPAMPDNARVHRDGTIGFTG